MFIYDRSELCDFRPHLHYNKYTAYQNLSSEDDKILRFFMFSVSFFHVFTLNN